MNNSLLTIGMVMLFMLIQGNAFAHQKYDNKFDKRFHKQSHSIKKGFYNGEFSYEELKKLFKKQYELQRLSREFLKDGYYGHRERKILRKKMDKFDHIIDRMRYNQKKYDYGPHRDAYRHQNRPRYKHHTSS